MYFTVQERGNVRLYRMPIAGGKPEAVVAEPGIVSSFSIGRGGLIAYVLSTPVRRRTAIPRRQRRPTPKANRLKCGSVSGQGNCARGVFHLHQQR